MSDLYELNSNMTRGEITPLLSGQKNLEMYYSGLASAKNVLGFPQGGQTKRHGMRKSSTVSSDGRMETFKFSEDDVFGLLFTPDEILIFQNGSPVYVPWSAPYSSATDYYVSATVSVSNTDYYCSLSHPEWINQKVYKPNDYVIDDARSDVYRCIRGHYSDPTITKPATGSAWASEWVLVDSLANIAPNQATSVDFWHPMTNVGLGCSIYSLPSYWTLAQIREFDFIQSADTCIITQGSVHPKTLVRYSDTNWVIDDIPFKNIPQFNFQDSSSPTAVTEMQSVNLSTNVTNGDRMKLSLEGILTDEFTVFAPAVVGDDNWLSTANAMRKALEDHPLLRNKNYIRITNDGSSPDRYVVSFIDDTANNWDLMIPTFTSYDATNISPTCVRVAAGTSPEENTWSATRGYPRTCTFFGGRLYFGGSLNRRNTCWGSRVGDFFNFDKGKSFDDDAIEFTLDTNQVNEITAIFGNRSLQIFTNGNEFFVPTQPITPEKAVILPQTNRGAKRVRPVTIDGITLFVQEEGKAIIQFLYSDETKANQSSSVSSASEHLIKDPRELVLQRATSGRDANYVFILNEDGTLAIFNSMSSQGVAGFSRWETAQDSSSGSRINSMTVVGSLIYALTERVINGSTVYTVEVEDASLYVDGGVVSTDPVAYNSHVLINIADNSRPDGYLTGDCGEVYFTSEDIGKTIKVAYGGTGIIRILTTTEVVQIEASRIYTGIYEPDEWTMSNTIEGLDHLLGETVYMKTNDGLNLGTDVVTKVGTSSHRVTYAGAINYGGSAGLFFAPEIKSMPLNVQLPKGPNAHRKKKIARVSPNLYNSNSVRINGKPVPQKTSGGFLVPLNGIQNRKHVLGWSLEAQVTFDQIEPEPFTILGYGLEVAV